MKFNDKIQKFMSGRYGLDDLCMFLFALYFVFFFINLFLRSSIISTIEIIIGFIIFYRFLSKKIYKRSAENERFLTIRNKILKPFVNMKRNVQDRNHIYKKCHHCNTTLKLPLPSKRGIKHSICPTCGKRITILALKKQKVKIIRNNQTSKTKFHKA